VRADLLLGGNNVGRRAAGVGELLEGVEMVGRLGDGARRDDLGRVAHGCNRRRCRLGCRRRREGRLRLGGGCGCGYRRGRGRSGLGLFDLSGREEPEKVSAFKLRARVALVLSPLQQY